MGKRRWTAGDIEWRDTPKHAQTRDVSDPIEIVELAAGRGLADPAWVAESATEPGWHHRAATALVVVGPLVGILIIVVVSILIGGSSEDEPASSSRPSTAQSATTPSVAPPSVSTAAIDSDSAAIARLVNAYGDSLDQVIPANLASHCTVMVDATDEELALGLLIEYGSTLEDLGLEGSRQIDAVDEMIVVLRDRLAQYC